MSAAPKKTSPNQTAPVSGIKVVSGAELSSDKPVSGNAANESAGDVSEQETGESKDEEQGKALKPASENIVLSSIRELTSLYTEIEEIRGQLRARGVQAQSSKVMVEMAFHNRQGEMGSLIDAALESSQKAYGHGAITREELNEALDNLLVLEKDVAYTRRLCTQRGLNLQVLNFLTQIVRQNPGDGGTKSVNTFLGYASACKIDLSGIEEIKQKYTTEPESVLPDIKRTNDQSNQSATYAIFRDVSIGLILTVGLMALLV